MHHWPHIVLKLIRLCCGVVEPAHKMFLQGKLIIVKCRTNGSVAQSSLSSSPLINLFSESSAHLTLAPVGSLFWLESYFSLPRLWRSSSSRGGKMPWKCIYAADLTDIYIYISWSFSYYRYLNVMLSSLYFRDQITCIWSDILPKHIMLKLNLSIP